MVKTGSSVSNFWYHKHKLENQGTHTGWSKPNVLTLWSCSSAICGWIPKPFQPCFAMIPRFYMPYELHWSVGYCLGKMRALIFMIFPFAIFLLPAVSSQEQQWSLHMAPVFIFTPFSDAIATGTLFSLKWVQCHDTMRKEMQDLKKIWGNQDKISHDFRNSVNLIGEVFLSTKPHTDAVHMAYKTLGSWQNMVGRVLESIHI